MNVTTSVRSSPVAGAKPAPAADRARFNPLLPEFVIDPYPQLHRLRQKIRCIGVRH